MGATFPRLKDWTAEGLNPTDLNAEFDNILDNLRPQGMDDYSTNTTQMRLQTAPGAVGSESLATSLAGELERLRYTIARLIGSDVDYWYEVPPSTLTDLVAAIGTGLPNYRIVSGRTTGNSSQMCALIPSGTTASVTLSASVTPFIYYIAGVQYSITANVTLTGLGLAAATNNTCAVGTSASQHTKSMGQFGTQIDVSGMNSSIAANVGKIVGLKISDEYALAYVNSTTSFTHAQRGCFFDSSSTAIKAVNFSAAEIKLMRLTWLFANTNSSIAVTYNNPTVSAIEPTGPATGDYWFDLASTAWKTYNSTAWVDANATLIGITLQNTAACVAARTFDSFRAQSEVNGIELQYVSATQIQARNMYSEISVFGTPNRFGPSRQIWDITTNLGDGLSESASTIYYAYVKENGTPLLTDRAPMYRRDLQGLYHPTETWRAVGSVANDGSSNFVQDSVKSYGTDRNDLALATTYTPYLSSFDQTASLAGLVIYTTSSFKNFRWATHGGFNTSNLAGNAWNDILQWTMAAGVYGFHANLYVEVNNVAHNAFIAISTAAGAGFADLTKGWNSAGRNYSNTADNTTTYTVSIPRYISHVTVPTVYYFKAFCSVTSGVIFYPQISVTRLDSTMGMPI